MEHTKIVAALGILAAMVIGMFTFTYLKKAELDQEALTPPVATEEEDFGAYGGITRINGKHFYEAPTHTVVGEILMPTPCDLLNWDARVQESMPETAIIDFTVINSAEACAQVITPQRFSVSFDASEAAQMRATLMGRAVELNLTPALPGENPEDFELFIKG
jgi:hypothetical protein